jgi:hypothetical protein
MSLDLLTDPVRTEPRMRAGGRVAPQADVPAAVQWREGTTMLREDPSGFLDSKRSSLFLGPEEVAFIDKSPNQLLDGRREPPCDSAGRSPLDPFSTT